MANRDSEYDTIADRSLAHSIVAGRVVRELRQKLPNNVGCLVMVFDYDTASEAVRLGFCSTAKRESLGAVLYTVIRQVESGECFPVARTPMVKS
jgi:hypothetical protein